MFCTKNEINKSKKKKKSQKKKKKKKKGKIRKNGSSSKGKKSKKNKKEKKNKEESEENNNKSLKATKTSVDSSEEGNGFANDHEEWCKKNKMKGKEPKRKPDIDFEKILNKINELREKHQSPKVEKDDQLCIQSQLWTEHIAKKNKLQHSEDASENIAYFGGGDTKDDTTLALDAIDMWYSEVKGEYVVFFFIIFLI